MTTKPHSNEEVIEEFYKKCEYERGEQSSTYTDRCANFIRTLLAQKDAEVIDARREIIQEIMSLRGKQILAYGSDKLPFVIWEGKADEREKVTIYEQAFKDIYQALTPPDQTANPTN